MMTSPVTEHPVYKENKKRWIKARDVGREGSHAVKQKGTVYLPRPAGIVSSTLGFLSEVVEPDYATYLRRAMFFGASKRTITNLVGVLFVKPATGADIDHIPTDNMDGSFNSIQNFNKNIVREQLTTSRLGLWVNWDNRRKLPYARIYRPENICDWGWDNEGRLNKVSILWEEDYFDSSENAYTKRRRLSYMALDNGVYVIDHYAEVENENKEKVWVLDDTVTPERRNGTKFDYIPFIMLSDVAVSFEFSPPVLEDLFDENLAHYNNSADYEWLLHFAAQPTFYSTGISESDAKKFTVGPTRLFNVPNPGPDFRLGVLAISADNAEALRKAMIEKEKQMVVLGARILETPKLAVEAAATVAMRTTGDKSNLETIADVSIQGVKWVVRTMADFMNMEIEEPDYDIDRSSLPGILDPAMLRELVSSWQQGAMSQSTMVYNFKRGNLLPQGRSVEDEMGLLGNNGPGGNEGEFENS